MRLPPGFIRRVVATAAVLALGLALACAPKREEAVVFWHFWPAGVLEPILARFRQEYPNIPVRAESIAWEDGLRKITAAVASGDVPDLCEMGSTWMPQMLHSGALSDWSAGIADLKPRLNGWSLCSIGDASYGVPWVLGTRALFYNRVLFARAGLDSTRPPETWAELREAAAAIQKLGGGVHGFGVQAGERGVLFKKFMPFAWGNGGGILTDDLSNADFDTPRNVEALEFYLSLREVGLVGRQQDLDREFREGRLGLFVAGAWLLQSIPRDAPGLRYGVALVPRPEAERGTHASFAGGEVLVGFTASKRKAEALDLARFLVQPENALALAQAVKSVQPATLGADTTEYYRAHPDEQTMIRQYETAYPAPNHPEWVGMEAAIEDEVEQALLGRMTAAAAVAAAHAKLDSLARRR